jgi:hypothetical protein
MAESTARAIAKTKEFENTKRRSRLTGIQKK